MSVYDFYKSNCYAFLSYFASKPNIRIYVRGIDSIFQNMLITKHKVIIFGNESFLRSDIIIGPKILRKENNPTSIAVYFDPVSKRWIMYLCKIHFDLENNTCIDIYIPNIYATSESYSRSFICINDTDFLYSRRMFLDGDMFVLIKKFLHGIYLSPVKSFKLQPSNAVRSLSLPMHERKEEPTLDLNRLGGAVSLYEMMGNTIDEFTKAKIIASIHYYYPRYELICFVIEKFLGIDLMSVIIYFFNEVIIK